MKTERLAIRLIEEDDWQSIRDIWLDFDKSEYVIYDRKKNTDPDSVKTTVARWSEASHNGKEHIYFVTWLKDEVIGFFSFNAIADGYEMGYGFLNKVQGNGYAKESLIAVLDYMKEIGAEKICVGTALNNLPSVGLLKSTGFELTGTEDISFHKDEEGNDIHFVGGNFIKELG